MSKPIRIEAQGVGLDIPLFAQSQRSVKASFGLLLKAAFETPQRELRTILDDISFSFQAGDRIGVVGRNGSGKSTLLKLLVGAYQPTRGLLETCGRRQALLNLSLGFNGEATLVENILLRGIAMGLRPKQAAAIIDEVLAFAELEEKAGHRLRTLSSGQRMRLGFALATAVQHEILVMDEWIGTGDAAFVKKAKDRIHSCVDNAQIVVLASHNLQLLRNVCNKALLLEGGRIRELGPVDEVLTHYRKLMQPAPSRESTSSEA